VVEHLFQEQYLQVVEQEDLIPLEDHPHPIQTEDLVEVVKVELEETILLLLVQLIQVVELEDKVQTLVVKVEDQVL
jgi:hypothetical protein